MKSLHEIIWEKSSTWKFEPFILLWNLISLKASIYFIYGVFINIMVILFYFKFDKKFTFKYFKKYLIISVLSGLPFFLIGSSILYIMLFIFGFDDAGLISMETKNFTYFMVHIGILALKVFYSIITSRVYQKQKRLSYENYDEEHKSI